MYKQIILIDDDPIANMISKKIIERSFTDSVIAFSNARDALDQFKEWWSCEGPESPVVIFLDINMPQMDGWQFLEEFGRMPRHVIDNCLVAMLTSSIDLKDIEKAKTYKSVREFISKPLTSDKLAILKQIKWCENP